MRCDGNINTLTSSWKQIKTCSSKTATFCNDYDGWETDIFDALNDYWSTGNGLIRQQINGRMGIQSKFLFPMCQLRKDKWTAAVITSTLRRLECRHAKRAAFQAKAFDMDALLQFMNTQTLITRSSWQREVGWPMTIHQITPLAA
jgi:hypothetical protein